MSFRALELCYCSAHSHCPMQQRTRRWCRKHISPLPPSLQSQLHRASVGTEANRNRGDHAGQFEPEEAALALLQCRSNYHITRKPCNGPMHEQSNQGCILEWRKRHRCARSSETTLTGVDLTITRETGFTLATRTAGRATARAETERVHRAMVPCLSNKDED